MDEFTYITAFAVGLMGGVHCVGMCGGIVGALSFANQQNKNSESVSNWSVLLGYNFGRLLSYTLLGGLAGLLASAFLGVWSDVHFYQMSLKIIAAFFMLAMGLYISGWWMGLNRLEKIGRIIWQYIQPYAQKLLPVKTPVHAVFLGLLWGWLPCGLVYSVLVWAISTGSFQTGALLMLSFGLGTLPNLLAMGLFANKLKQFVQKKMVRSLAGGLVVLFGVWNLVLAIA